MTFLISSCGSRNDMQLSRNSHSTTQKHSKIGFDHLNAILRWNLLIVQMCNPEKASLKSSGAVIKPR